jgi:hypothetical protein
MPETQSRKNTQLSYTIYPGGYDPAPGRGVRPVMVGITFAPTPSMTIQDMIELCDALQSIIREMQNTPQIKG